MFTESILYFLAPPAGCGANIAAAVVPPGGFLIRSAAVPAIPPPAAPRTQLLVRSGARGHAVIVRNSCAGQTKVQNLALRLA
mmetsp:Transcript_46238/g.72375  ORF Transcript_46238/g.72375 Transcript_46238/m.72375 type:complete len:82 (-) Transcript_46238:856-1101(-)